MYFSNPVHSTRRQQINESSEKLQQTCTELLHSSSSSLRSFNFATRKLTSHRTGVNGLPVPTMVTTAGSPWTVLWWFTKLSRYVDFSVVVQMFYNKIFRLQTEAQRMLMCQGKFNNWLFRCLCPCVMFNWNKYVMEYICVFVIQNSFLSITIKTILEVK